MLIFKSLDTYVVQGKGIGHLVHNQVKQSEDELIKSVLGTTVLLSGIERRVLDVDCRLPGDPHTPSRLVKVGEVIILVVEDTRTAEDIAFETIQTKFDIALRPQLTDEFLATLSLALDTCGWRVDIVAVEEFVEYCYEVARKPAPPFNDLNPTS